MPKPPYIQESAGSIREGRMFAAEVSTLTVDDHDLAYIRVDHQARLQFGKVEVVIESAFTLETPGVVHELEQADRTSLGPFLGLYPDTR